MNASLQQNEIDLMARMAREFETGETLALGERALASELEARGLVRCSGDVAGLPTTARLTEDGCILLIRRYGYAPFM